LNATDYLSLFHKAAAEDYPYPDGRFYDTGIVVVGGGERYFTCAWVCISMLRLTGCTLPVQLWYIGWPEMDDTMRQLALSLPGVDVIDATLMADCPPGLTGWQCKCFALMNSKFERVFLIDADNVPVVNVETLINYFIDWDIGTCFWPEVALQDGGKWPSYLALECLRDDFEGPPALESGQLYINKRTYWRELNLAWHLNLHGPAFWYEHTNGDKDTFLLAWRDHWHQPRQGKHWNPKVFPGGILQVDYKGDLAFVHRTGDKWSLHYRNNEYKHPLERECFDALLDLSNHWDGRPHALHDSASEGFIEADYRRLQHMALQERKLKLWWDGRVTDGSPMEGYWNVRPDGAGVIIGPDFHRAEFLLRFSSAPLQVFNRHGKGLWRFLGEHDISLTPAPVLPDVEITNGIEKQERRLPRAGEQGGPRPLPGASYYVPADGPEDAP
jgi:hypothetical protein